MFMAMLKKKTKAAENKAARRDHNAAKEKEQSRESHKGKGTPKEGHKAGSHEGHSHLKKGSPATGKGEGAKAEKKAVVADIAVSKMSQKELEAAMADLDVLKFPLVTEKAVNMIEAENKLTFVVAKDADKPRVKKAVENLYKVKVTAVNIIRDMKSRKRAIVSLDKKFKASDVATKLGVI